MFSYLAYERFRDYNEQNGLLSGVCGFMRAGQWNVRLGDRSNVASGQLVTGDYYSTLGAPVLTGRLIGASDDDAGADPVAVLSYRYWEQQLGMAPDIVGQTVYLNRVPLTIIGVTAPEFRGVERWSEIPDVSIPMSMESRIRTSRSRINEPWSWWLMVMGRLKPGVTAEQVQANLNPVFQQAALEGWNAAGPDLRGSRLDADQPRSPIRLIVAPAATGFDNMDNLALPVMLLSIVTEIILVIVCANLANLLLAKSSGRHQEIAVRLSVGATRRRLLQQLLTESVILAFAGGAAGLLVAYWTDSALEAWLGSDGRPPVALEFNFWVLGGTVIHE